MEAPKLVKVRLKLAIDAAGKWSGYGWSGIADDDFETPEEVGDPYRLYWIEAWVQPPGADADIADGTAMLIKESRETSESSSDKFGTILPETDSRSSVAVGGVLFQRTTPPREEGEED